MITIGMHIKEGDSRETLLGHFTDIGVHETPRSFGVVFTSQSGMSSFVKLDLSVTELFTLPDKLSGSGTKYRLGGTIKGSPNLGISNTVGELSSFVGQEFVAYYDTKKRVGFAGVGFCAPLCPKHKSAKSMERVEPGLDYFCRTHSAQVNFPDWMRKPVYYTTCFWCGKPVTPGSFPATCWNGHEVSIGPALHVGEEPKCQDCGRVLVQAGSVLSCTRCGKTVPCERLESLL